MLLIHNAVGLLLSPPMNPCKNRKLLDLSMLFLCVEAAELTVSGMLYTEEC